MSNELKVLSSGMTDLFSVSLYDADGIELGDAGGVALGFAVGVAEGDVDVDALGNALTLYQF